MEYTKFSCANFIVDQLIGKCHILDITILKLQKLLFFAYGIHLTLYDEPLFEDEYFEAWQHGPVLRSVYKEFKNFGNDNPIIRNYRVCVIEDGDQFVNEVPSIGYEDEKRERSLLYTCLHYDYKIGWQMVDSLHNGKNSVWSEIYEKGKNNIIPPDKIKKIFESNIVKIEEYLIKTCRI